MAAAGAALFFALLGMMRLPKAAVLPSLSKRFKLTLPESLAAGQAFVPPGRSVAVFRDEGGVYEISLVCTHLGCIVKPTAGGFECPCHGSRFGHDGSVARGPAPKGLPWLGVSLAGGTVTVDEDTVVQAGTKKDAVA